MILSNRTNAVSADEVWFSTMPLAERAANLMNQQLWCWGRDVEFADGNLLMQIGCQRIEKPSGSQSASVYRFALSPTARIVLRGFGVFCGDDRWGGLFVPRFEFTPQLTPKPDLEEPPWSLEHLPPRVAPGKGQVRYCQQLLLLLIDWIRQYEVWIADEIGIAYRRETLQPWEAKHEPNTVVAAEAMAASWRELGTAVANHPDRVWPDQQLVAKTNALVEDESDET
jgi:hypothetical protein